MIQVIKRDGRTVDFDKSKIVKAIVGAMKDVENKYNIEAMDISLANYIADRIEYCISSSCTDTHIEDIQETIEEKLMQNNPEVAKAYIRYRERRSEERRKRNSLDIKISELINLDEKVANENANKDSKVFNTQRDLLAGIAAKDYALRNILPKNMSEAHSKGEIHIHDLDYSPFFAMYNCMLIDFEGMLEKGFTIGNADIETPRTIIVATTLVAQIVANVSSNIYGGTTFNRADEVLEKYAKGSYEKHLKEVEEDGVPADRIEEVARRRTSKEIYKAMKGLEYEINTLYNSKMIGA